MNSYNIAMSVVMLTSICTAAPYVTNVVAKTRMPWNGLVDVSYEIVGSTNGLECVYGQLTATDRTRGKTYVASTFEKNIDLSVGKHTAIWNMSADTIFASKDVVFNLSIQRSSRLVIIDLSGGVSAESYPTFELNEIPAGGWGDDFKMSNLVLRIISPGSFTVNSKTLGVGKAFYIGIFEVTQKQYELVMGVNPSRYKGDLRPVEMVTWNDLRGDSLIYDWPKTDNVDDSSFVGRIRKKTGLKIDLPTLNQWEYACRAFTTSSYNNGGDSEDDLKLLGRYSGNKNDGKGGYCEHTVVGSYAPNSWGLYDMHGNVFEWCLNANDNGARALKSGCWYFIESAATSEDLFYADPTEKYCAGGGAASQGVRLVCNLE